MLYATGYQRLTLAALLEVMEGKEIKLLVDIRSVPFSRNLEFTRRSLERALKDRYLWKGDILGGKWGPASEAGLNFLMREGRKKRLLLLCMEFCPCDCHRLYDISRRLLAEGVDVLHLYQGAELTTKEMEAKCDEERRAKEPNYMFDFSKP